MKKEKKFQNIISEDEYEKAAIDLIKALLQEKVPLKDIQYLSGKDLSEIKNIATSMIFE